ncbi:MAG: xanthine dehydrogenase family protein molybdopterin-binding subunit [Dehalococcoidia bacterium]
MEEYKVIGKPITRIDSALKVTGQAIYAADISLPGQLHCKLLRAPYAHAKILNIDTSRAERLTGVRAVVTGKDFPQTRFGFLPTTRDRVAWPRDKVRHWGEAVAAVAATSEDIAEEALDLIRVDYEELPAVFTSEEAMREGAALVHENMKGNVAFQYNCHYGDVDKGFAESDYVKEIAITSQRVTCGFIEPHSILTHVDASGRINIQASLQSPYIVWRHFCRGMDMPLGKVRIINPFIGGGFSGKQDPFDLDFAAVKLAMITGRPVKCVMGQDEVLATQRQRHSKIATFKLGAKRDGTLMAVDATLISEGGAYACVSPLNIEIFGNAGLIFPYRLPNIRYDGKRIYTNKAPCGSVRGQSLVIARYMFEAVMSEMADDLGLDQYEVRYRNAYRNGDVTPTGWLISDWDFAGALKKVAEGIGWEERKKNPLPNRGIGFGGIGLGTGHSRISGYTASGSVIKVAEDGSVNIIYGGTEIGQGLDTVVAQVTAEVLGVPMESIIVGAEDTDYAILEAGMYASRGTVHAAGSIKAAAEDARNQLAGIAAQMLEVAPEKLEFAGGRIFVQDNPDRGYAMLDVVRQAYYTRGEPIYGRGVWVPPYMEFPATPGAQLCGQPWEYTAMAQAIDVEVDPETGKVRVVKSVNAYDVGQVVNPLMMAGQMEGGTLASMGQALFEESEIDDQGRPRNANFEEYKMCTSMDAPEQEAHPIICPSPHTAFGVKGGGEISTNTSLPAVTNAISAATGVRFLEMPITPGRIVKALQDKGKSK